MDLEIPEMYIYYKERLPPLGMTLHNIHTHYKLSGEDVVFF